jgi:hypothetical protein
MGEGRFARPLRGLVVLAMLGAGLDTTQWVEFASKVPPDAGVVRLLVSGVAVEQFIDCRCIADGMEVTY